MISLFHPRQSFLHARYILICLFVLTSSRADDRAIINRVITVAGNGKEITIPSGGPATSTGISQPFGICTGPDGALYVCEVGSHVVRRVDLQSGILTTVAGCGRKGYSGDGGVATSAELNEPYEVRFDSQGNMLFVEMQNHLVRKVDAKTGIISTLIGSGTAGFSGDGGPATAAQLNQPHSIALDNEDRVYICDIRNHRIRVFDPATGLITTFAGTGAGLATPDNAALEGTPLNGPRALDFDGDHSLYLALREGNAIFRIDLQKRTLQHLAGTGKSGYSGDGGPAKMAQLSGPKGVSLSKSGDLYFADTESHTIRVLRKASEIVETVVGDGKQGDGPDGEPKHCRLNRPHGVFVSADNWLYIGDSSNHRVRRLRLVP
jgi:DNA-binding beta-propeller fold protein YncE